MMFIILHEGPSSGPQASCRQSGAEDDKTDLGISSAVEYMSAITYQFCVLVST